MLWSTISSLLDLLAALCADDLSSSLKLSPHEVSRHRPLPVTLTSFGLPILVPLAGSFSPPPSLGVGVQSFPGYSLPLGSHPVTHMPTAPDV